MSRSRKGSKGPGYDFMGRRLGNEGGCASYGPIPKQITHRKERRASKRLAYNGKRDQGKGAGT